MNPVNSDFIVGQDNRLQRRVFFALACLALTYAFLAGFHTVGDLDTGWQVAAGRWAVQHHRVPPVDVLSYTAPPDRWTYPVGAGVLLYLAYMAGGFTLLSCISAAGTIGTVALLLRRGCAAGAGIAILAVPLIAQRTQPRADMFSIVFFSAFLSILWQYYREAHAPLWALPVIMLVWVNFHFGFAAGLGLVGAYVGVEVLDVISGTERRSAAVQRLRRAWKWLAATSLVTFVNPWGWRIYATTLGRANTNLQQRLIGEWQGVRLNWPTARAAFTTGGPGSALFLLLAVAIIAAAVALFDGQWGPAIILLVSAYAPFRHIRMEPLFACIAVVIAGPILNSALLRFGSRLQPPRARCILVAMIVLCFAVLACARCADLVSNRFYFSGTPEISTFGTGLGWWFPRRAAEFVQRENLPGEIFNSYAAGGYLSWKLGPQRRVYIYGLETLFGESFMGHQLKLMKSQPDSPAWETEANQYGINTVLLSISDGMELAVKNFCDSTLWRPVYLDEVSAVIVRRSPATEQLIQHFPVNCATAPLPVSADFANSGEEFAAWINAAGVLEALGREQEALSASDKALNLFPNNPYALAVRADALASLDRWPEAEQELSRAAAIAPSSFTWSALANLYRSRGNMAEAIEAMRFAAELSPRPYTLLSDLGYLYLKANQPQDALRAFQQAERSASPDIQAADNGTLAFMLAQGRSVAWHQLGHVAQAVAFQEKAAQLKPNAPEPWRRLAKLYRQQGRAEDAIRAELMANTSEQKQQE